MATKTRIAKTIGDENTAQVDPRSEYVSGYNAYGSNSFNILPDIADELHKKLGDKAYEHMEADPEIAKCINVIKTGVLADGITLINPLPEFDPDFDEAEEIKVFCEKALKHIDGSLTEILRQQMDAIIYGHKIAEITYDLAPVRGYKGKFLLPETIKVQKQKSINFVVDKHINVIGMLSTTTTEEQNALKSGNTSDLSGKPILPREKFMVLTLNPKNGDPRGCSLLKPAFNAWHLKMQMWPEYLRFLLLCSIPLLVGYTPEDDTTKEYQRDSQGDLVPSSDGKLVEISQEMALRDALMQARTAEVLALKGGSEVQEVGGTGAGTAFWKAIEMFDRQMEMGILNQTLAVSEGTRQSRSAAETHRSTLDQLIWSIKGVVSEMLTFDLLRHIVRYNFGDNSLVYLPQVSLGDAERHEFGDIGTTIANLFKAGYFQPEQLKAIDKKLGIPPRHTLDPEMLVQQLQSAGIPIEAVPAPIEQTATIQSGTGGGNAPLKVSDVLKTGVKGEAIGRSNSRINKSPKNSN